MIVLDASAGIEWLLQTAKADAIETEAFANARTSGLWHAPHLIDLEVAQVLRKLVYARKLSPERANDAVEDLLDLPLTRYPHDFLLPRVWELRENLSAYDAAYVALAEMLDLPLLTCDARLASAGGHQARVRVV